LKVGGEKYHSPPLGAHLLPWQTKRHTSLRLAEGKNMVEGLPTIQTLAVAAS
jgi:hypothetical protein